MTASTYGAYGGRYVPETLIPALDELERGWEEACADASFRDELDRLGSTRPRASRLRGDASSSSAKT